MNQMKYRGGLMLIAWIINIKITKTDNAEPFMSNPNETKAFLLAAVIWVCDKSLLHPSILSKADSAPEDSCQLCAGWSQRDHLSLHAIANYEQIRATVSFLMRL